ncbi:uncharacterized protein LOC129582281 [Paramacrobiotus metropolitanus]|uniref:uncharacterized protein LOC129582281 n=1 Tax=Paramacrobiotus metropolitanus TaxID=2943436 RepID=UPI0024456B73|nr:uncharacterized protein LOC129582281 [Paramacrobiotus metropolitanus]
MALEFAKFLLQEEKNLDEHKELLDAVARLSVNTTEVRDKEAGGDSVPAVNQLLTHLARFFVEKSDVLDSAEDYIFDAVVQTFHDAVVEALLKRPKNTRKQAENPQLSLRAEFEHFLERLDVYGHAQVDAIVPVVLNVGDESRPIRETRSLCVPPVEPTEFPKFVKDLWINLGAQPRKLECYVYGVLHETLHFVFGNMGDVFIQHQFAIAHPWHKTPTNRARTNIPDLALLKCDHNASKPSKKYQALLLVEAKNYSVNNKQINELKKHAEEQAKKQGKFAFAADHVGKHVYLMITVGCEWTCVKMTKMSAKATASQFMFSRILPGGKWIPSLHSTEALVALQNIRHHIEKDELKRYKSASSVPEQ